MDTLRRAIRSLRRSPGYTATAIGSIAVGLALATATFAVVDAMLHPKLPFPGADQLYYVQLRYGDQRNPPSVGEQLRLIRGLDKVEGAAAMWLGRVRTFNASRYGGMAMYATPSLWPLVGIPAEIGRLPTEQDARERRSVVVRHDIWERDYAGRPSLEGATIKLNDISYDIVGVLPMKPALRLGGWAYIPAEERASLDTMRVSTYIGGVQILARLKPGETPATLQGDLDRIAGDLTRAYVFASAPPYRLTMASIRPRNRSVSEFEMLFIGLAIGVLAIGCTNVAALSLARGIRRQRDVALRRALGASRWSVAAEVLAEIGVLAVIGGAIGFGITYALLGGLTSMIPAEMTWTWLEPPEMNVRVFLASAGAMFAAIALAGAAPAIHAARVSPADPLKDAAGTTTGRSRNSFRALVIGELAIAMVLLMMASLMTLSVKNRLTFDFGFDAAHTINARVSLPRALGAAPPARNMQIRAHSIELARSIPGVRGVTIQNYGGVGGNMLSSDRTAAGEPSLSIRNVTAGGADFFATLGIPIVSGRDLVAGDMRGDGAVVLSQRAAKALFPRGDALGRKVKAGPPESKAPWVTVVGISRDFTTSMRSDVELLDPSIVFADTDTTQAYWSLAIRTEGDPTPVVRELSLRYRDAFPPRTAAYSSRFMDNWDSSFRTNGFFASVFGILGFAAAVLGALGVFSVLSYVVGQRSREFAVRVALGATEGNVVRVVMRNAIEFALGGTAIGALLSFWASAGVSGFLFGVKNTDPVSLLLTEALLIGVTLLAALAPALRASRANPLDIIRAA